MQTGTVALIAFIACATFEAVSFIAAVLIWMDINRDVAPDRQLPSGLWINWPRMLSQHRQMYPTSKLRLWVVLSGVVVLCGGIVLGSMMLTQANSRPVAPQPSLK